MDFYSSSLHFQPTTCNDLQKLYSRKLKMKFGYNITPSKIKFGLNNDTDFSKEANISRCKKC